MQLDTPTPNINPCICGHKPTHYSTGYGPNPYYISCQKCKKTLSGGSGYPDDFIQLWNTTYAQLNTPNKFIDLTTV